MSWESEMARMQRREIVRTIAAAVTWLVLAFGFVALVAWITKP